jgi:hypothetical protein
MIDGPITFALFASSPRTPPSNPKVIVTMSLYNVTNCNNNDVHSSLLYCLLTREQPHICIYPAKVVDVNHPSVSSTTMMSSQGSGASLSPAASEQQDISEIPIETLIDHLLNAKKALSSVSTLWRANEIVSAAQSALEESVILTARTGFLRSGISQQVRLLEKARGGIQTIYNDQQADFQVRFSSRTSTRTC